MSFALVDVNNFYASCERVFNPRLANRLVVVLSNNDGCVIARSAEAKQLGVPMGMPFFQVAKLLKQHNGVALSSNYALYGDMSRRVMTILARFSPRQEIYSIDECFLAMDGLNGLFARGQEIRQQIRQWTGLPVCVGFGASKTLAKLANHCAKKRLAGKDGVCNLLDYTPQEIDRLFGRIAAGEVWGVGRRLTSRLEAMGVTTVRQLRDAEPKKIRQHFSVVLERTVMELRGESCLSLEEMAPAKQQIICSRSFGQPVLDLADLREAAANYTARAAEKLRVQGSVAGVLQVFVQTNPFKPNEPQYNQSVAMPFPAPTADTRIMTSAALEGLERIYRPGYRYKKVGVMLLGLCPAEKATPSLFDMTPKHSKALMAAVDAINRINGRGTIRLASEGIVQPWKMRRERMSRRYTTRWDELLQIG